MKQFRQKVPQSSLHQKIPHRLLPKKETIYQMLVAHIRCLRIRSHQGKTQLRKRDKTKFNQNQSSRHEVRNSLYAPSKTPETELIKHFSGTKSTTKDVSQRNVLEMIQKFENDSGRKGYQSKDSPKISSTASVDLTSTQMPPATKSPRSTKEMTRPSIKNSGSSIPVFKN